MSKVVLFEKHKSFRRLKKHRIGIFQYPPVYGKFIKGPICFTWITQASKIGSRALSVGVLLWYWYGLSGSRTVKVTTKKLGEFGISRRTCFRALEDLENSGLVLVDRKYGRAPHVKILINV